MAAKPDIKLVAIDLDGTLLNSEGNLTDSQISACRSASERVYVVVATGRRPRTARKLVADLDFPFYLITYSGGQIEFMPETRVLNRSFIEQNDVECAVEAYLTHDLSVVLFTEESDEGDITVVRGSSSDEYFEGYLAKNRTDIRCEIQAGSPLPHKVHFMTSVGNPDRLAIVEHHLKLFHPHRFNTHLIRNITLPGAALDLLPISVSKSSALQHLTAMLGIEMDSVAAIGDDVNDIDMMACAGLAIAMANARQEVKEIADYITKSNEQDGVAYALCNYLGLC